MQASIDLGIISPGDLIIVSYAHGHTLGFYRGRGNGTFQFYSTRYLSHKLKNPNSNWSIDYMGGDNKTRRVAKYHPDLVEDTSMKEQLNEAIEYIKISNILPSKY